MLVYTPQVPQSFADAGGRLDAPEVRTSAVSLEGIMPSKSFPCRARL